MGTADSTASESVESDVAEKKAIVHFEKAEGEKIESKESPDGAEDTSNEVEEEEALEKISSEEEDEEDDNITDFGAPPKCRWVKISCQDDDLCPFSGSFRKISSTMKKDSIAQSQLRALLLQEGCTEG